MIKISKNAQQQENILTPPTSVTHPWSIFWGFIFFILSMIFLKYSLLIQDTSAQLFFVMVMSALPIFSLDIFVYKVHQKTSTGLNFKINHSSLSRTITKLLGLGFTILFIATLYWLFPEYHGDFYIRYWSFLKFIAPIWFVAAGPYFYFVDQKMVKPKDAYWQMGQLIFLNFEEIELRVLRQHLLGWMVKGFFFPLMLTYFSNDLARFMSFDFKSIIDFRTFYDFFYEMIFTVDVGFVSMGYIASFKLTDTHLRSAEGTVFGWVIALICYEPFWSSIGRNYIKYDTGLSWGGWLADSPILFMIWGSSILILFSIYVWASLIFGCRFSNLTNRGIITNGPYRWTKHPAYISKNLAWWLTAIPFISPGGSLDAIQKSILLLFLNGVYFLRAKTEESHLCADPDYLQYSKWIEKNGLFKKFKLNLRSYFKNDSK